MEEIGAPPKIADPQTGDKPIFRYSRLIQIRWFLCFPILIHLVGIGTSFTFRPMSFTPGQSVIFFFETIGPYWPTTFGVSFVLLLLALVKKKRIEYALFFSMCVFLGLFVATLYGVIFAGGGWVAATGAISGASVSWLMGMVFLKGRG